jgi:hypothetical protein
MKPKRKPAPKKLNVVAVQNGSEQAIHLGVARLLHLTCPSYVMWTHFPAGEVRSERTGAKLKRMGLKPGWPDFICYDTRSGYLYCIEVKAAKGVLSQNQKNWKAQFDQSPTGRFAVVRSVQEASTVLREWFGPQTPARIAREAL